LQKYLEGIEKVRTFAPAFAQKVGRKAKKEEFFERIYINREVVVQEAFEMETSRLGRRRNNRQFLG